MYILLAILCSGPHCEGRALSMHQTLEQCTLERLKKIDETHDDGSTARFECGEVRITDEGSQWRNVSSASKTS